MNPFLERLLASPVDLLALLIAAAAALVAIVYAVLQPKLARLIVKNLGRNPVRTALISLATMVLVAKVTLIWSVVHFLDLQTRERSKDMKLIITERWQVPSLLPMKYADYLNPASPSFLDALKGKYGPNDFMTWSFYVGSIDANRLTQPDLMAFFFVMSPEHIKPMMEDSDEIDEAAIDRLRSVRNGCLMGRERMAKLNKRVGERFKITSLNFKGIDLEFEIVGELPDNRYSMSAIMRVDYFLQSFAVYEREKGTKHPLIFPDDRRLNLIWLRVPDRATFNEVGSIIERDPHFSQRPVRVDMATSLLSTFLEAYKDLIFGVKYLLVPAILVIMALVVSIAISISVRERRTEIAVMKVLGFRPNQVLHLVLGESVLLGGLSGLLAAALTYVVVNHVIGGIKFPVGFFPAFMIPIWALAWGPAMGAACAVIGSLVPSWRARSIHVSEVFSKVA